MDAKERLRKNIKSYRKIYAVYVNGGEDYAFSGTADEVADWLGLKRSSIYSHACLDLNGKYSVHDIGMEIVPYSERMHKAVTACRKRIDNLIKKNKVSVGKSSFSAGYLKALEDVSLAMEVFDGQDREYDEAVKAELDFLFSK